MQTDVLIIGGGIAGLTCAVGLRDSGLRVTMVEQGERLGGRAQSWVDRDSGDVIDIGPHIFLTEYRNLLALLKILGTQNDIVWQKDEFITFLEGRKRITMHMHRLPAPLHLMPSLFSVPTLSSRDILSNRRVIWLAMRMTEDDALRLDKVDAEGYLQRAGVTRRFIEWYWATLSMALMNVPLRRCSAGALLRLFRDLITHNGYHIGFAGRALSELFAPQAARVIQESGGRIIFNSEVQNLLGTSDTVTSVALNGGVRIDARFCVSTVPPQDLRRILPGEWLSRHPEFAALAYFLPCPYISTCIWFSRKVTRKRFWARVWSPKHLNTDSYDLSNIRLGWGDRPSVITSNIIYSDRDRINELDDEDIIAATVRELGDFTPEATPARVIRAVVNRIPMAKACPYPGTENRRPRTVTPIDNLLLAGDWTRTELPGSMESAARAGWLAAEEIWARIGQPRTLAFPIRPPQGIAKLVAP